MSRSVKTFFVLEFVICAIVTAHLKKIPKNDAWIVPVPFAGGSDRNHSDVKSRCKINRPITSENFHVDLSASSVYLRFWLSLIALIKFQTRKF